MARDWQDWCIHDEKQIAGFGGPYRFLSNFYPCPNGVLGYNGLWTPTSEHAYQLCKVDPLKLAENPEIYERVSKMTTFEVKKWGNLVTGELKGIVNKNWYDISLDVMRQCVFSKFLLNKDLRDQLIATGDKDIREMNYWGDTFWGTDLKGNGYNHLGIMLMDTRAYWRRSITAQLSRMRDNVKVIS